ncbi:MAG: ribonuclease D [Gammaproteobacteria bacterium]|jgi:ribonuclease D|nr:ribonuclease D [Gammaproteobacteria bacterium]
MNDISAPLHASYIDTPEGLDDLCSALKGQPWIALDTEFMREDTYYPRLCLLQLAAPGTIACVDPLALTQAQLDPLLDILYESSVTKIFHACHQDMEIFHLLRNELPSPVFDTQIAAPLLGYPVQASYARLVEEVLGTKLEKAHTRTDWSRRPLSSEQLDYAADDVRFLGPLYLDLRRRLEERGMLAWLEEDFTATTGPTRYRSDPQSAWLRVRGTQRMSGQQLAVLRELAAWRESAAQRANRPRGWLLRDDALIEIASRMPAGIEELQEIRGLSRQMLNRHGEALLTAIAAGRKASPAPTPRGRPAPLDEAEERLYTGMSQATARRAAELGIDAATLASRGDLVDLIRGNEPCRLLSGWKRAAIGEELLRLRAAVLKD